MSARINPNQRLRKRMELPRDLEGFRDFEDVVELVNNLEDTIDEDELLQSADELEQDDDDENDDAGSSPNFIRRFQYKGIFGSILPIIIAFIVGYVLIKCIEEVISDN